MPQVKFIEHNGAEHIVDAPLGDSIMQAAVNNNIAAIVAECGGGLACATCHCYVDEAWFAKVGAPGGAESEMLESTGSPRGPTSRLSCQITMTEALDGIVVRLPATQY